jgi:hypothetical protein
MLRQKELEFEVNLEYIVRYHLKKLTNNNNIRLSSHEKPGGRNLKCILLSERSQSGRLDDSKCMK